MRYQLDALPVLYTLLKTLQVRQLINRHCPEQRDVDYGTVAIVLVLNLFFNRIALLAYTLLQRQMQQRGIQLTTVVSFNGWSHPRSSRPPVGTAPRCGV